MGLFGIQVVVVHFVDSQVGFLGIQLVVVIYGKSENLIIVELFRLQNLLSHHMTLLTIQAVLFHAICLPFSLFQ